MEVGYVIGIKMDVMWIWTKLVNYGKSHKWPKEVVWINFVNKWVYGSILANYVKKNIEKCVRLMMGWFLSISAKLKWCKREVNVHIF